MNDVLKKYHMFIDSFTKEEREKKGLEANIKLNN